mgnify:CR=1 FL=1
MAQPTVELLLYQHTKDTAALKPESASQIRRLAENMDLFEFAPGAHTPEEYGKYMIQKSGHFEYDPNLDEFYACSTWTISRACLPTAAISPMSVQ